ncbi:DUF2946 domain-containing protein [Paraburkholderia acidisoli]|uniref:DUF2946 domain-containing protein n=2 Tax=Paraburkholderia acidisoli TaxID=2571748 RepID=A0A7Z2GKP8_9BURK|nr:DUF2946 domain-containing protein [Paraburkholderia acidisoli]
MATLAPVVSHWIAQTSPSMHAASPCGMPSMQGDMHAAPGHTHGKPDHADLHASGGMDDCGYCSFFAHLPAVTGVPVPLFVVARLVQSRIATRFESVRLAESASHAHARAPPLS